MDKRNTFLSFLSAATMLTLSAATGCTKDGNGLKEAEDLVFQATSQPFTASQQKSVPETKTVLGTGMEVLWCEGDEISIFSTDDPESNRPFTASALDGSRTEFHGKAAPGGKHYAAYPYKESNKMEGSKLSLYIEPEQTLDGNPADTGINPEGSFSTGINPATAIADGQNLDFKNQGALISFKMPELGNKKIIKAVFRGNDSESIAGDFTVDMSSAEMKARTVGSSLAKVSLSGNMESGKTYHFVTFPRVYNKGFTMNLYTDKGESINITGKDFFMTKAGQIFQLEEFSFSSEEDLKKEGNVYHIYTAEGLRRFADIVNSGDYQADAVLENDIDLSGTGEWTPIGKGTVKYEKEGNRSNVIKIGGHRYSGSFDGNGKTISNLKIKAEGSVAGGTHGFFGILDNASVKGLTLGQEGDASQMTVNTSGAVSQETGVLAGCCHESSITDVTNHVKISYTGSSTLRLTVGVIGSVHSDQRQSVLERVVNRADIDVKAVNNNENGWAKAVHVGGVCGAAFSGFDADDNSKNKFTVLSYCENYGNITSNAGRTAGIAGATPYYGVLNSCFNHGKITSNATSSGYVAGMTIYMSTMSAMQDCINNGDIIATDGAGASGLVGLCSYANAAFSACGNFGDVISDNAKRGVFVATNSATSRWLGCTAAGNVGTWNKGQVNYDVYPEASQIRYLGPGADKLRQEGTIWQIGASEVPQGPEPELRILFIGNSFTQDAVNLLPNLLEGAGIKTVELGLMYWGGSTIAQHNNEFSTNSTNFTYYRKPTSVDGTWLQYKGYTLESALKEHDWDIVTIQEHTGRDESWIWDTAEKNAINGLISKVLASQTPNVPEIWYIFSQAYHNLEKSYDVKTNFSSTEQHYAKISAQAKKIKDEITTLSGLIPSGTVLQNLRASSLQNELALTRDGYHMDYGISRYAAACAVYESLILKHFPTCTLENNTFRIPTASSGTTPVTDANRPIAISAARKALAKPFEVTPAD